MTLPFTVLRVYPYSDTAPHCGSITPATAPLTRPFMRSSPSSVPGSPVFSHGLGGPFFAGPAPFWDSSKFCRIYDQGQAVGTPETHGLSSKQRAPHTCHRAPHTHTCNQGLLGTPGSASDSQANRRPPGLTWNAQASVNMVSQRNPPVLHSRIRPP